MPLLPGANPVINGHSPANQPTQFSYANAVKKSAEPSESIYSKRSCCLFQLALASWVKKISTKIVPTDFAN